MSANQLVEAVYLYKVLLDNHARKHNCTIQFLNQHTVLWGIQKQKSHRGLMHQSNKGVCAGLSIEWIKASAKGIDFMAAIGNARNKVFTQGKTQGFTGNTQQLLNDVDDSHTLQNNLRNAFPAGLGKKIVLAYPFKGSSKVFSFGNYYYISSGSHAVAVHCTGSKINFYDPNVGLVTGAPKRLVEEYIRECVIKTCQLILNNKSPNLTKKNLTIIRVRT